MKENEDRSLLTDEENRLLNAFDKMSEEKQKDLMDYLQHLLHMQEHAPDLQLCND